MIEHSIVSEQLDPEVETKKKKRRNKDKFKEKKSEVKSEKKTEKSKMEKNKNEKNNKKVLNIFKSTESNEMLETIQNDIKKDEKSEEKGKEGEINFEEYLATDPGEMDYDDAIKLDQRSYCQFFAYNLKERVLFANTFIEQDPLRPITIKTMVLILTLIFYFFINGFFFNEEYISKVYHLDEDKFFDFVPRSIKRFFYALVIGEVVEYITEFFFVEENRIKGTFDREKDNLINLKNEIIEIVNDIKRRNLGFIIVVFILIIFFIYYVLCFNYVYHYSQVEWIKSSIVIILANQILSILLSFFETSFRFLAFKCKSERLYQFSQIFD